MIKQNHFNSTVCVTVSKLKITLWRNKNNNLLFSNRLFKTNLQSRIACKKDEECICIYKAALKTFIQTPIDVTYIRAYIQKEKKEKKRNIALIVYRYSINTSKMMFQTCEQMFHKLTTSIQDISKRKQKKTVRR